jgi:DNA mismatch endonuclease (patch repair protein)
VASLTDVFTKAKRSWVMGRVRSKDTGPERAVRSFLHRRGFRFSLNKSSLPGTPDIVLARHRTVVFVHSCFFHGHPGCKRATTPASNRAFWVRKIRRNRERDAAAALALRGAGWRVIVVWECQVKKPGALEQRLGQLRRRQGEP